MVSWTKIVTVLGALALQVRAQVPNKPADYQLNHSTIIMPCNNSGESAAVARAAAARAAAWRRGRCASDEKM
jgi:hypothetical protein